MRAQAGCVDGQAGCARSVWRQQRGNVRARRVTPRTRRVASLARKVAIEEGDAAADCRFFRPMSTSFDARAMPLLLTGGI